jgi:alpha-ribazole phosphatase
MRLYLVRHPKPALAGGICYGSTDVEVAPASVAQVLAALVPALPSALPVYSSPLRRCLDLAWPLAAALGANQVRVDARLVELDFGHWENRPWDAIARDEIDAWAAQPVTHCPGGGESVLQAAQRVQDFVAALRLAQLPAAIVVCHAGTIRLALALLEGVGLADAAARAAAGKTPAPGYGSLTMLDL